MLCKVKMFLSANSKKVASLLGMCVFSVVMAVNTFAAQATVGPSDWAAVQTAITDQVNVANIAGVLASVIGVTIGLVFFWWGLRKVVRMIMSAFKRGRQSI